MRKTVKKVCCLALTAVMVITGSSIDRLGTVFEAYAEDVVESAEMELSGYKKIGDTVSVANAPDDASYYWTVTSQITGLVVATSTAATLTTSDEYNECKITCTVTANDDVTNFYMYCSSLPVLYIDSDTEYGYVTKEDYSDVTMKLVGNEEFTDEELWYEGKAQIKLRGNSTAYRAKSPYRVKLGSKADLLGLGQGEKSKHWVLLANDIDHSLIRNKLLYDFSGAIGTEFYFDSTNVSVMYNGEYIGVYQLCEHRRVDDGRIEITDWVGIGEDAAEAIAEVEWASAGYSKAGKMEDALNEVMYQDYSWMDSGEVTLNGVTYKFADYDIELPEATGGFLAEMDFYSIGSTTQATITTAYGQPLYFSHPEAGSDAADIYAGVESFKQTKLFSYAYSYTQSFEYALHSTDFVFESGTHKYLEYSGWFNGGEIGGWSSITGEMDYTDTANDGKHYSELFDMDSLVTNFVFVEYAMNWDSMKNSFFFYKDIDGLAKIGPQWDFDWSLGNINMYDINTWFPTSWQTTNEMYTREQAYQSYNWNRLLIKDPYFLVRVYEKYNNVRDIIEEMVKDGGTIDQYAEQLAMAGLANDARWDYTYYDPYWYSSGYSEDFVTSIDSLKTFLTTRVEWLDEQFASIDSLVNSLGYYQEATDIDVVVDTVDGDSVVTAVTTNADCKKIAFQINGTTMVEADVVNGVATATIPADAIISDGETMNVVVAYEMGANGEYILNTSLKPSDNYEYIAKSAYAVFMKDAAGTATEIKTGATVVEGKKLQSEGENSEKKVLTGDGTIEFEFEVTSDSKWSYNYLWVELFDNNSNYMTTVSHGDAWFYYGGVITEGIAYSGMFEHPQVGDVCRVTLTREGNTIAIKYYNVTAGTEIGTITGTPVAFTFGNTITAYVQAKNAALQMVCEDNAVSINTGDIVIDASSYIYTGKAIEPTVKVTLDNETLDAANYKVQYYNNTDKGIAVVLVTGDESKGFRGTVMKTFKIVSEESKDDSTGDSTGGTSSGSVSSEAVAEGTVSSAELKAIQDSAKVEGVEDGVELKVNNVDTTSNDFKIVKDLIAKNYKDKKYIALDLKLMKGDKLVQPNGKIKVTLQVPERLEKALKIDVYRVEEDGSYVKLESKLDGKWITFETDHFSTYVFVEANVDTSTDNTSVYTGDTTNVTLSMIMMLLACAFVLVFNKKSSVE